MRFRITVFPDGRGIITTTRKLSDAELVAMRDALVGWRKEPNALMVLDETEVVHTKDIEFPEAPKPKKIETSRRRKAPQRA